MALLKLRFILLYLFCVSISSCGSVGGTAFPEPSENYEPTTEYSISTDDLWSQVMSTLETLRIPVASTDRDEGRIVTEYIQGPMQTIALMYNVNNRYNYSITLQSVGDTGSRINILCTLEGRSDPDAGWNNITNDNMERVENLENWLYEQIESSDL